VAAEAEHADERVTEDRVAEMADVGGLVRVDVGVLDDDLAGTGVIASCLIAGEEAVAVVGAIEAHVDIAVAGDLESGDAGDGSEFIDHLLRDVAWGLLQLAGQLEGRWYRELAEGCLLGLLDLDGEVDLEAVAQVRTDGAGEFSFDLLEHYYNG